MSRKKIAISLFLFYIFGRMFDILSTFHYSPNLAYEANPLVNYFGNDWYIIFVTQFILLCLGIWFCFFKLANSQYNKPSLDESILNKFFKSPLKTPQQRYVTDFSFCFLIGFTGFIAGFFWIMAHSFKSKLVNWFLGLYIGDIPISLVMTLVIGYWLGKIIANRLLNTRNVLFVN